MSQRSNFNEAVRLRGDRRLLAMEQRLVLVVRCPGDHDWSVDSRCSNCTEPCVNCGHAYLEHNYPSGQRAFDCDRYEPRDGGAHRCWVRHGTPPIITVDKNGLTCQAGAGSILMPGAGGWHGFLRNGELVP